MLRDGTSRAHALACAGRGGPHLYSQAVAEHATVQVDEAGIGPQILEDERWSEMSREPRISLGVRAVEQRVELRLRGGAQCSGREPTR